MENLKKVSENTVRKYSLEKDGFIYKTEATFNDNRLISLECNIEQKQSDTSTSAVNKGYMNISSSFRKMINVEMDVDSSIVATTFEEIIKAVTPETATVYN